MSEPRWSDDLGPGSAHPDVAGWVLGALDPQDAEEFAVHLRSCTACQQAEQELRDVPRLLDAAAPPVDLPPGLQARTLRAVELAAVQDAHRTRRQRRTRWVAAAAAVVVFGGGGVTWAIRGRAPAQPTMTITMAAPGGGPATGSAVGHKTVNGWAVDLTVTGLPQIPSGQGHYECWYVAADDSPTDPDALSAGSFEVTADGRATEVRMWTVVKLMAPGLTMLVTHEPDNDPRRTGRVVLTGKVTP